MLQPCTNATSCRGESIDDDDIGFSYCEESLKGTCETIACQTELTQNEVNNKVYPWATYAYLPFLVILGSYAEVVSYRTAILTGVFGRLATRFILLFGTTLLEMQLMQVTYAMGSAAEDIFRAFVYYVMPTEVMKLKKVDLFI